MATLGMASAHALAFLNWAFRGQAMPAPPSAVWIKFHTGHPGPSGTTNPAQNTNRYLATFALPAIEGEAAVIRNSSQINLSVVGFTETYTNFSAWTTAGPSGGTLIGTGYIVGGSVGAGTTPTFGAGDLFKAMPIAA